MKIRILLLANVADAQRAQLCRGIEGRGSSFIRTTPWRAGLFTWDSNPKPLKGEDTRGGMMLEFTEELLEGRGNHSSRQDREH